MGAVPPRAPPQPTSSLLLVPSGPVTYSGDIQTPPLPPNTPLYSFKDYFLSAPDVNKAVLGPASTHTPILHLSHHSLSPLGFLLFSLHLHPLHKLFPPI